MKKISKVILLGSGALKIGQAGEFDYSGNQAIKAMKEEGIEVILVNPNIATIQTDKGMADKIYFLPVNPTFVEKIIEKERPDGILLSFGGQTALNCGVELNDNGTLKKYDVEVLGTSIDTIKHTEDRDLFVKKLDQINVNTPRSIATSTPEDAINAADKIGYPVMVRIAFALGGMGSGMAKDRNELKDLLKKAFSHSNQILIEEYLGGWKEIEYEVVRDKNDNCITVCNMENFDPLGIHTGESIVIAPSQTLTNKEYHMLREIAIKTIKHLGIIGECNIQYALDPKNEDYRVIEVNARLSRSSALASKATGYPLAFVAAKLAIGKNLSDIKNSITEVTSAFFEPALDYIVVKIPRWDLKKFRNVSKTIGTEMKSVGEVMSIGKSFEEAVQKAIRMLDIGMNGFVCNNNVSFSSIEHELKNPTDRRIFAIEKAFNMNMSIDSIHNITKIDRWFLEKLKNIHDIKQHLKNDINANDLLEAKKAGFSDYQIAMIKGITEDNIRKLRHTMHILPSVKQIDTLAGEFPAKTNYLYLTYHGNEHDIQFTGNSNSVMIIGGGPYRIGSSVEFDWCCVTAAKTAKKTGHKTIMINCNPETVSTDYDECDRLYFEELSFERIQDIYYLENPKGIILSMGGQIPNNLAIPCYHKQIKILGTSPQNIDRAEDRNKFSALLDTLEIKQPDWIEAKNIDQMKQFAKKVGYPLIIRPSYVLSGAAMNIISSEDYMEKYMNEAAAINSSHPVVMSKFILDAKEIELDAVAQDGKIKLYAISEHIENAGIHSGDATIILPAPRLYWETERKIRDIAAKTAHSLNITGPFNIQFIAKDNDVKVIECNLRASRSFPFVSKVLGHNFIELATRAILGIPVERVKIDILDLDYVGIKTSQFSFSRLKGADPLASVEMASTGEVGCFGDDVYEAFMKSVISTGMKIPQRSILISVSGDVNRYRLLDSIKMLKDMNFTIYSTEHTNEFLKKNDIDTTYIYKISQKKSPNVLKYLADRKLCLIISISKDHTPLSPDDDNVMMRKMAVAYSIPLISNLQLAKIFIKALSTHTHDDLKIKSWDEYTEKISV